MSVQTTVSEVQQLGPALITLGGANLGHCEAIALKITYDKTEATVGQYGKNPTDIFLNAVMAELEATFDQFDMTVYNNVIAGSVYLAGSGAPADAISFGGIAGKRLTAAQLIVTPSQTAVATLGVLTLYRVVPMGSPQISWDDKEQKVKITFQALIQEGNADGNMIGKLGTQAASADTVAPTVSSISPAEGGTLTPDTAPIVVTFSKAIKTSTLTGLHIFLALAATSGTPTPVACTYSYNSSTNALSIQPNASLSSSTAYELVLTQGITDNSGNQFAGAKYNFTTA